MKQVITGPYGLIAYHAPRQAAACYPALNIPDCGFARGQESAAANSPSAPGVVQLPRRRRARAAVELFGTPGRRGES
ncbi:hypothetical protein KDD17_04440 [Sulfitobacter albidus]|uniref:Uncharacterized protein n=1 Tax=Sulfitobacter albidus TaxID=2829501 RepID=A0A975PNG0_9RHOB|nr:hypothetical protein [Sulfitobacter albidus]QUJ77270.1 hypothetical protein KDD17_04440 [Sulfitobacter albidus]